MANSSRKKSTSLFTVIFWLFLFFPIGIYFLLKKSTEDKGGEFTTSKKLLIFGCMPVIFATMCLILTITGNVGEGGAVAEIQQMIIFFYIIGGFLIFGGLILKINKKNNINSSVVENRNPSSMGISNPSIAVDDNLASLEDFAEQMASSFEQMQSMMENGNFQNVNINVEKREFVQSYNGVATENTNDNTATKVPETKVVTCKNCGANNKVTQGQVAECEYCGSLIE
jgi:hypothetical protein